jgi:hypothetical protein
MSPTVLKLTTEPARSTCRGGSADVEADGATALVPVILSSSPVGATSGKEVQRQHGLFRGAHAEAAVREDHVDPVHHAAARRRRLGHAH